MGSSRRVVLITGCSSGIGAHCATQFAQAGDRVVATMRQVDAGRSGDSSIELRELDVTNITSIQQCVAGVLDDYGRIDVLVNNAGIHLLGAMEDMPDDAFRRVFETNFFGAVNLARAVLPSMRAAGQGRIVSVSSIGSLVGRVIDGAYCASKAALETALEAMRHEVARFGVHVSVVCPSAFRTGIGEKFGDAVDCANETPYRQLLVFRHEKIQASLSAGGDPADVASLIRDISTEPNPRFRYLIGDQARRIRELLTGLDDVTRQALLVKLADIDWWVSGKAKPDD